MRQTPQFDLHPDAESLNAFAEQVLPEKERGRILGHVASCGRCRQIVYLAQEAAEEMEAPAWASAAQPAREQRRWFQSWRVAWVPAAALAAFLGVAVTLHLKPAPQNGEFAKAIHQQLPAVATPMASQAPAGAGSSLHVATQATSKNAETATGKVSALAEREVATEQAIPVAVPPNVGEFRLLSAAPEAAPAPPGQAVAPQGGPAALKPEAAAAWQQEQQRAVDALSKRVEAAARVTQAKMRSTADHIAASGGVAYSAAAEPFQAKRAPANSFGPATPPPTGGLLRAYKAAPPLLPSGLSPVSTATIQRSTVAVDQAGGLFVSDDFGKTWAPVSRQWTGRAVQVRASAGMFEVVNDGGLVWVSVDGKAWKAR